MLSCHSRMHADLEKLVTAGKIPADFAARLNQFSPGNYVIHQDLGVGKVAAWSLAKSKIKIDFEKGNDGKIFSPLHGEVFAEISRIYKSEGLEGALKATEGSTIKKGFGRLVN